MGMVSWVWLSFSSPGCRDEGAEREADSDIDTDLDSDTDTGAACGPDFPGDTDSSCSALPVVTTSYRGNEWWYADCGPDYTYSAVALSADDLDRAWEFFDEPRPAQPEVDWESEMVLVYADYMDCAMCGGRSFVTDLLDCGDHLDLIVSHWNSSCDGLFCAGVVTVAPRDDREVRFESRESGRIGAGDVCMCEGDEDLP